MPRRPKSRRGVSVQASTLGSLEALLEFLRVSKIPVCYVNIGPVFKRDGIQTSDYRGFTPLSMAARRGVTAIADLLLSAGADVDSADEKFGQTPLSWAAENGPSPS